MPFNLGNVGVHAPLVPPPPRAHAMDTSAGGGAVRVGVGKASLSKTVCGSRVETHFQPVGPALGTDPTRTQCQSRRQNPQVWSSPCRTGILGIPRLSISSLSHCPSFIAPSPPSRSPSPLSFQISGGGPSPTESWVEVPKAHTSPRGSALSEPSANWSSLFCITAVN